MRHSRVGERGFTLLEVLVALAILGVGMVSVMELFGSCMKSISKADQHTKAVFLAKKILDDDLFPLNVELGQTTGTFDEPFDDFSWSRNIEPFRQGNAEEPPAAGIDEKGVHVKTVRVTLTVSITVDEESRDIVELDTLKTYFDSDKDDG